MILWSLVWFCVCLCFAGSSWAEDSSCVKSSLKCWRIKTPVDIHGGLAETSQDLDKFCRVQERFYNCLRDVVYSCEKLRELPEDIEKETDLLKELCIDGTDFRKSYLEEAPCINRQNTSYCSSPDYLAHPVNYYINPISRCALEKRKQSCISVMMTMKCGDGASQLLSKLVTTFDEAFEDCKRDFRRNDPLPGSELRFEYDIAEGNVDEAKPDVQEKRYVVWIRDDMESLNSVDCDRRDERNAFRCVVTLNLQDRTSEPEGNQKKCPPSEDEREANHVVDDVVSEPEQIETGYILATEYQQKPSEESIVPYDGSPVVMYETNVYEELPRVEPEQFYSEEANLGGASYIETTTQLDEVILEEYLKETVQSDAEEEPSQYELHVDGVHADMPVFVHDLVGSEENSRSLDADADSISQSEQDSESAVEFVAVTIESSGEASFEENAL